jgi:hypothetical protein
VDVLLSLFKLYLMGLYTLFAPCKQAKTALAIRLLDLTKRTGRPALLATPYLFMVCWTYQAGNRTGRAPMADLIGRQLGQYLITGVLGSGGMATVYRAQQTNVKREV